MIEKQISDGSTTFRIKQFPPLHYINSYDALVTDYWPEFGANGKGALTLADILRHEGGLMKFDESIAAEDLTTQRIKENSVGAIIERQSLE